MRYFELEPIRRPELIGQLLDHVAARSGGEIVVDDLGRELQAISALVESYLQMLETLYLVRQLPGWTTGPTNRVMKRRVAHLVGQRTPMISADPTAHRSARCSR